MEFSTAYFGKELEKLKYSDIENFFNTERDESDKIEFKAYSVKHGNVNKNLEGVMRGICAFLNSDGGILIWGAPEGETVVGRSEKVFIGDLSPVNELIEKDRLISKISDSITPLPVGIKVQIIENDGAYIYVFEVQSSNYKPHQFKNSYCVRLDGQTKPAPHYLIESLFKQIQYPNLEGYLKFDKLNFDGVNYKLLISILIFNFSELQNEESVEYRLICDKGTFFNSQLPSIASNYCMGGHQFVNKNLINVLHYGAPEMHQEMIIIPTEEDKLRLVLSFGGKKSPAKVSQYTLKLPNELSSDMDLNTLISEKEENVLIAEKKNVLGQTKEDTLRSILGR